MTYILTQDIPPICKKGEEFAFANNGYLEAVEKNRYDRSFPPAIAAVFIKTGIMVEKEEENWVPEEKGQQYWLLTLENGEEAIDHFIWNDEKYERNWLKQNRIYPSLEAVARAYLSSLEE